MHQNAALRSNSRLKLVLGRIKNNGKMRKCWLPQFSPFPTMFSKAFSFRVVKNRDCVVKNSATSAVLITLTRYQTTNFRLFQTERVCRRRFQI